MRSREATAADVAAIFAVRTAVNENLLTLEQMARRGITPETVAASLTHPAYAQSLPAIRPRRPKNGFKAVCESVSLVRARHPARPAGPSRAPEASGGGAFVIH
jgi:hypothetical protein